jgi:hypothetical protein
VKHGALSRAWALAALRGMEGCARMEALCELCVFAVKKRKVKK